MVNTLSVQLIHADDGDRLRVARPALSRPTSSCLYPGHGRHPLRHFLVSVMASSTRLPPIARTASHSLRHHVVGAGAGDGKMKAHRAAAAAAANRRRVATSVPPPPPPPGHGVGNSFPDSRDAAAIAGLWRTCLPPPRLGAPAAATAPARAAAGATGASAGAGHGGTSGGAPPLPGSTTAATATSLTTTFPGYAPPGAGGGFSLTTNDLARLTAGAVRATAPGGTSILATVATAPAGGHLAVDYRERAWARGRIPGSFLRREMGPSDRECLASRLIDRSLRPLLPAATGGVHVTATLVAGDLGQTEPADVLALTAASAAVEVALGVGGGGWGGAGRSVPSVLAGWGEVGGWVGGAGWSTRVVPMMWAAAGGLVTLAGGCLWPPPTRPS